VSGPDARWDVPVHVVTSRGDVAAALHAAGFVEGVSLEAGAPPLAAMVDLTALLLGAFDSGAGPPHGGSVDKLR
jgi:hypothetical protein